MAGITTAYHLLRDNPEPPRILILEARTLCSGATARNGGHCKIKTATLGANIPKLGADMVDDLAAYVHSVIYGIKQIVEEEELDCEFELRMSSDVQTTPEESERLKKIYDRSREHGSEWTKERSFIDYRYAEQVTSIKGAKSSITVPVCSFWPYKFVTQLTARLLSRHPRTLNIQTTTPVHAVTSESKTYNIVKTSRGDIRASKVVFATNAYTAGLIPQFKDVITPVRGMATHIIPKLPVHPHLFTTYNIEIAHKGVDYLNPRPDGSIVVGGGKWMFDEDRSSWLNNWDDSVRFPAAVENYWNGYMQRVFLGWEDSGADVDKTWVGIMGVTPDEWPHVGRVPESRGQWMLAGFNGGGMALILTASKVVARMVRENLEFDSVAKELGVPAFFGTSVERLQKKFELV